MKRIHPKRGQLSGRGGHMHREGVKSKASRGAEDRAEKKENAD